MPRATREQQDGVPDPAIRAEPEPQPAQAAPARKILRLQSAAGNAAVSHLLARQVAPPPPPPTPTAVVHHTQAELEAMTLNDFDRFARDQADWATEPGKDPADTKLPAAFVTQLRNLLEFARESEGGTEPIIAGCGDMKVQALLDTKLGAVVRGNLRAYSHAVSQSHVTVKLDSTADLDKAQKYGAAVRKVEAALGPGVSHSIFQWPDVNIKGLTGKGPECLTPLMDAGHLDDFLAYARAAKPMLAAPGAEVGSYLALRAEGGDPMKYLGRLHDVRNFHRFEKDALDALLRNQSHTNKDLPLFLILHSNLDHNGAFHRDPNLTAVITSTTHLTLMIEGKESLAEVSSHLKPLAHKYGQGNKVEQVMIAGHGNNDVIQLAGKMDKSSLDAGETADDSEQSQSLTSAPGRTKETDKFMAELLANMANDPKARIVLNGCLTASNTVGGPLDPDPKKAAQQVQSAIQAQPSLQTYMAQAAAAKGSHATVRGANASFNEVALQDSAGNLDIVPTDSPDPMMTAPKIDYVKAGTEPQGALRAVLETWAADHVATPAGTATADAIANRLTTEGEDKSNWNLTIIRTLYRIVQANPTNAELIRQLESCAGDLSELRIPNNCRVAKLASTPAGQLVQIFTALSGTDTWKGDVPVALVILQRWLHADAGKKAGFMAELDRYKCSKARDFVDFALLGGKVAELLPVADAASPTSAQLKLALLGTVGVVDPACKAFLKAAAGTGTSFPPALGIKDKLDNMSTENDVEIAVGLHGGSAAASTTPTAPPDNVDLDRDGTNDARVEPMTRRGAVVASALNVRQGPDVASPRLDALPNGAALILIGTSGDFYAIEYKGGTAFVHKDFVKLTPQL